MGIGLQGTLGIRGAYEAIRALQEMKRQKAQQQFENDLASRRMAQGDLQLQMQQQRDAEALRQADQAHAYKMADMGRLERAEAREASLHQFNLQDLQRRSRLQGRADEIVGGLPDDAQAAIYADFGGYNPALTNPDYMGEAAGRQGARAWETGGRATYEDQQRINAQFRPAPGSTSFQWAKDPVTGENRMMSAQEIRETGATMADPTSVRTQEYTLQFARPLIQRAAELAEKINQTYGVDALIQGRWDMLAAEMQTNPDVGEYLSLINGPLLPLAARTIGKEVGNLSESDREGAREVFPLPWESRDLAARKVENMIRVGVLDESSRFDQSQPGVDPAVAAALQSAGPGIHTLSDRSRWIKDANGQIRPAERSLNYTLSPSHGGGE